MESATAEMDIATNELEAANLAPQLSTNHPEKRSFPAADEIVATVTSEAACAVSAFRSTCSAGSSAEKPLAPTMHKK